MNGATVGGVIGFAIGSFFGMGQVGWMIGSAIGGYIDPEKIEGPRLSDARTTTSRDGIAIPFGYGTFSVAGNVIWQGDLVEHRDTERQGKGGGPEVTTYTYTRSYAIGICEGPISGILQIKRNGKVVYDARDDATLEEELARRNVLDSEVLDIFQKIVIARAWNARFARKATFYSGGEEQLPDPTIEAVLGVGNVPAYRGLAYMVVEDDDVTDLQGAIPQFEFVVVTDGVEGEASAELKPLQYSGYTQPWLTDAHTQVDPRKLDVLYEYGYIRRTFGYDATIWGFDSPTEAVDAAIAAGDTNGRTYDGELTLRGWRAYAHIYADGAGQPIYPWEGTEFDANTEIALGLVFSRYPADVEHDGTYSLLTGSNSCPTFHEPVWSYSVNSSPSTISGVYIRSQYIEFDAGVDDGFVDCQLGGVINGTGVDGGEGSVRHYADFIVMCRPVLTCGIAIPPDWVEIPDAPGSYVDSNGVIHLNMDCTEVTGTYKMLAVERTQSPDDPTYITPPQGPVLDSLSANYSSQAYWDAAYAEAVADGTMPSGWAYSSTGSGATNTYPVAVSTACECVPVTPTIVPGSVLLSTIVANLCEREGLTSDEYDVSQLTDLVPGFRIANEGDAASAIAALMPSYFFDVAEWDGKVRFIKRGGESVFAINGDDLVERDGDPFERERVQEAELLRRVTVGYIDPQAGYGPTTQKWERRVGTVQAKGESSVELPLTLAADTGATIAKRRGLTAWGEPEKQKFSLPYRLAAITPTDVGSYTDGDGEVHYLRIMQAEDDSGVRYIESSTNCAEAYNATATGVIPLPPSLTQNGLIGPTQIQVMDLPIWRTTDADTLGVYVAASGYMGMDGWHGAQIDVGADEGVTYTTAAQVTTEATIGYTTTDLEGWVDSETPEDREVTVTIPSAPESVTRDALLRYNNRAAIRLDSGEWSILQYQTVTANGDDSYTLSGLVLGRFNTTPGDAAAGATFVLLDGAVQFVPIERDMAGTTITVRATSYGTSTDAAGSSEVEIPASPASQTEWPVHSVSATRDGSDNVTVTWVGRGRLGTETSPYHSTHFTGYRVTYSDGETFDVDANTTTHTRSSAPPSQTITVSPLNDITGEGPASEAVTA